MSARAHAGPVVEPGGIVSREPRPAERAALRALVHRQEAEIARQRLRDSEASEERSIHPKQRDHRRRDLVDGLEGWDFGGNGE